jgi:hypothetical protein
MSDLFPRFTRRVKTSSRGFLAVLVVAQVGLLAFLAIAVSSARADAGGWPTPTRTLTPTSSPTSTFIIFPTPIPATLTPTITLVPAGSLLTPVASPTVALLLTLEAGGAATTTQPANRLPVLLCGSIAIIFILFAIIGSIVLLQRYPRSSGTVT